MSEFVLVHGGMHGAWCWEPLCEELAKLGHRGVPVDVPMHDLRAGYPEYIAAVAAAQARWDAGPILVGHSLAGLIIPHVAKLRALGMLIFLCAMIAPTSERERMAFRALANATFFERQSIGSDGRPYCTAEVAEWAFFHDVPAGLKRWAVSKLVPINPKIYQEMALLDEYPNVRSGAIITTDDHMIADTEWLRSHVRQRLGVEPLELAGSHSPFLSRPGELAQMLSDLASAREKSRHSSEPGHERS